MGWDGDFFGSGVWDTWEGYGFLICFRFDGGPLGGGAWIEDAGFLH